MKQTIVLNNGQGVIKVDGKSINTEVSLKDFRKQLQQLGCTELRQLYRAGKHVVEFLTYAVKNRLMLVDSGFIKGTKEERKELKRIKGLNPKDRVNVIGYSF